MQRLSMAPIGVFVLLVLTAFAVRGEDSIPSAMVKIYTVYNRPDYHQPWQMRGQDSCQGSGCIISGNRILTNAHVVGDQIFIQVRRAGESRKYTARVETVAHDCDLAILRVDDNTFFAGASALPIGELPKLRDTVAVYGFPEGGDRLSITEGVVSRVEHGEYAHSNAYLLVCQVDASINAGSSGGPVVRDRQLVGVAFQGLPAGTYENIGYMVPAPVIRRFLKDIEDGRYDGTPDLGIAAQKLENPDMRRMFQLAGEDRGVLITRVYPESPARGALKPGDILLRIDGQPVGSDGTIEFRTGERTYFGYRVQEKLIGDKIDLEIQRGREIRKASVRLTRTLDDGRLVPHQIYDRQPTYFIYGGLVFAPLTLNYLMEYGDADDWYLKAPEELLNYYHNAEPTDRRRQVIILIEVLPHEINVGYHGFQDWTIEAVNGRTLSTMEDLVSALEAQRGAFQVLSGSRGVHIVLDRAKAEREAPALLQRYGIQSDRSPDLEINRNRRKAPPPGGPGRPLSGRGMGGDRNAPAL